MQTASVFTRWIVRLAGVVQIVLGVLFWTGHALSLVPVHMIVGMIVVLGLWTLAVFAGRAGPVVPAIVLGLALPIVGVTQARLVPGSLHWTIQVVHLLLGLGVLRLAEGLAEHVQRRAAVDAASAPRSGVGEHGGAY